MTFNIREAKLEDAAEILKATELAIKEKADKNAYSDELINVWATAASLDGNIRSMEDKINNPDFYFLVAEDENGIVGQSSLVISKKYFGTLYVKKGAVDGVGKALAKRTIEYAKEKGLEYLELRAPVNVKEFYSKYGFVEGEEDIAVLQPGIEMKCVHMKLDF